MSDDEAVVRSILEDVVDPLLRAAGGRAELVAVTDEAITVRLHGEAAFGAGAPYVREDVVGAALERVRGGRSLTIEQGVPRPPASAVEKALARAAANEDQETPET